MRGSLHPAAAAALVAFQSAVYGQAGVLENPAPSGTESGIGVISGWHCTGQNIEFRIDGVYLGRAGSRTSREDTQGVCGRSDTGFSLLFNYNLIGQGTHQVEALADGIVFATTTFSVGTLGAEFVANLSRPISVPDFPAQGTSANMRWAESKQNFVIEGSAPTNSLSLFGDYMLSQFSVVLEDGMVVSSSTPGVIFEGTMTVRPDGTMSQTVEVSIGGVNLSVAVDAIFVDHGYYMDVSQGGTSTRLGLLSRGNVLTSHVLQPSPDGFTEVDVWTRTTSTTRTSSRLSHTTASASVESSRGALPLGLPGALIAELLQR